jgi:hypothetical protein
MKRLRDARHPMTLCTPFRPQIGPMLVMTRDNEPKEHALGNSENKLFSV